MSRRPPVDEPMSVRVLICRGCCCGTARKHPDTDHDAQLAALSASARVRVVDCVDECSRSNVIIVRPGDGTSVWFGRVLDEATTAAMCDWLIAGAPRPVPAHLASFVFERNGGPVVEPVHIRSSR